MDTIVIPIVIAAGAILSFPFVVAVCLKDIATATRELRDQLEVVNARLRELAEKK